VKNELQADGFCSLEDVNCFAKISWLGRK